MSTQSLHQLWSLTSLTTPSTTPRATLDEFLLNDLAIHRWGAHYIAVLLNQIPSSETRVALSAGYGCSQRLFNTVKAVMQTRGTTIPQIPDIPADWKNEAAMDQQELYAALTPHMGELVKEYAKTADECIQGGKCHWTSIVASLSVMPDVYLEIMTSPPAAKSEAGGVSYLEALMGDETLGPYREVMMSEELVKSRDGLREEVMRLRSEGEKTGWREEEAKQLSKDQVTRMREWFSM